MDITTLSANSVCNCIPNFTSIDLELGLYHDAICNRFWEVIHGISKRHSRNLAFRRIAEGNENRERWPASIYAWVGCVELTQKEEKLALAYACKALSRELHHPPAYRILYGRTLPYHIRYGLRKVCLDYGIDIDEDATRAGLNKQDGQALVDPFRMALAVVKNVWPEAGMEFDYLIREVVFGDERCLRSSTLTSNFGSIFLFPKKDWSIIDFVDLIIHETAHHVLEIKMSFLTLLKNPEQTAPSPLRGGDRPMSAILHAAFVLFRVISCMKKILKEDFIQFRTEAQNSMTNYLMKLDEACGVLRQHADFTSWGSMMFTEISSMLNE